MGSSPLPRAAPAGSVTCFCQDAVALPLRNVSPQSFHILRLLPLQAVAPVTELLLAAHGQQDCRLCLLSGHQEDPAGACWQKPARPPYQSRLLRVAEQALHLCPIGAGASREQGASLGCVKQAGQGVFPLCSSISTAAAIENSGLP